MGQLYGDRWEIISDLGQGGQGVVYLVKDLHGAGSTHYVLKRLKNLNRLERFRREVEAVRNMSHENIVQLIDFNLEGQKPYLVTEYCEGRSLESSNRFWIDNPIKTIELFEQVCKGVAFAHAQGIVHRDIKPANIFLRSEYGPAVVGDFGICYIESDGERLTLTEEAVGPRQFIAPELEDGRALKINSQSDIYSLGKLLYWLFSGGKMFSREKHRDQQYDLKQYNENSLLRWDNIYMEHINRILDYMIIAEPSERRRLDNLMILLREAKRLIQDKYNPVDRNIRQLCTYCGQGFYIPKVRGSNEGDMVIDTRNFGFNVTAGADWRVMVCGECGHVQAFRVDIARNKDWWK